jgi:hypothetical protein
MQPTVHSSFEDEGLQGEIGNKDNNQMSTEVFIYTTPHASLNTTEEVLKINLVKYKSGARISREYILNALIFYVCYSNFL